MNKKVSFDFVRTLWLYCLSFLGETAIYIVNLTLVYHMRYTMAQPSFMIGLAAGLYTIVCFLSCLTLSKYVFAIFKPWTLVTISTLLLALASAGVAASRSVGMLFFFLIIHGFAISLYWGPLEAWSATGIDGARLNRTLGIFNICWVLGIGCAPYITSFLIQDSMTSSFLTASGLAVLIAISCPVLNHLEKKTNWKAASEGREEVITTKGKGSAYLRVFSYLAIFISYMILSVTNNIFPLFSVEQLSLTEKQAGEILLLRGVVSSLFFIVYSRTSFWQFKPWIVKAVILLLAFASALPAVFSGLFPVFLFLLLFGVFFPLCYDFSIFNGAAGREDKGKRMMRHEGFANFGSVAGAIVGGLVYDSLGFAVLLLSVALITVTILIIFQLVSGKLFSREMGS